ncbi:MAG: glycerol kinase GlpK [Candidatus Humimicrobiaceae bacterium]
MSDKSEKYIIALDQGTTSSRAVLFDSKCNKIASSQREFRQIYPKPGWVEHNPNDIWDSQISSLKDLIRHSKIDIGSIETVGIANQRETIILWEKNTGKPVYNAIVWQCRRTSEICKKLEEDNYADLIREKTGLLIDPYFSGTKIKWVLDNIQGLRKRAQNGEIYIGTVDSWLIWNLTGGKMHVTDFSNASRTMLFNINTLEWDEELLELFDIPKIALPKVKFSSDIFGITDKKILGREIPITSAVGDQQAALFGQACFETGMTKCTYGTGCFILMNIGPKIKKLKNHMIYTIAWGLDNKIEYAAEGSIFIGGAAIQWLRDGLQIIKTAKECDELAEKVMDSNGVFFVPAFVGIGTPYWNSSARGAIFGLTRGVSREHIAMAALQGIAFQVKDVLSSMEEDTSCKLKTLKVDGGASVSDILLQFQSDLLQVDVLRPKITETTALGCAMLAGLKIGLWRDKKDIVKSWSAEKIFSPVKNRFLTETLYEKWKDAVSRTLNWID